MKNIVNKEENLYDEIDEKRKIDCWECGHEMILKFEHKGRYIDTRNKSRKVKTGRVEGYCFHCGFGLKTYLDQLDLQELNDYREENDFVSVNQKYVDNRTNQLVRIQKEEIERLSILSSIYKEHNNGVSK